LGEEYPVVERGDPPLDSLTQGRAVIHDAMMTKKGIAHLFNPVDLPAGVEKISFSVGLGEKRLYLRPLWGPVSQAPVPGEKPEAYEFESVKMADSTGLWIRRSRAWQRRPQIWTWSTGNQKVKLNREAFAIEGEHLFVRLPAETQRIRLERIGEEGEPLLFYGTGPMEASLEER
ncbi:MAG: hypothetical protein SNJ52_03985, partial [Verrucomicrobiia bacterium]